MGNRVGPWWRVAIVAAAINGVVAGTSARSDEPSPKKDQASPPNTASGIALIDIGAVYKNSRKFQREMEELKRYADSHTPADFNEYLRKSQRMDEILAELGRHEKGSAEYERLGSEWSKLDAETLPYRHIQMPKQNKVELMRWEARIYYDSYQDICDAVREYAEANGIYLVLRRTPVGSDEASSLMNRVKREGQFQVVFHNAPDITAEIIRRLNELHQKDKPGS